jgi:transcriptional regulator with XRE-family HTH domain
VKQQTVKETVAGNIRAYRQLRGLEQSELAHRMRAIGIPWRQATVSEVERSQRNVTVTELLGLTITLNATVEQFVDTRGPASRVGPQLVLADQVDEPAAIPFLPSSVTVLVCPHKLYAEVEWVENELQGMEIKAVDESAS